MQRRFLLLALAGLGLASGSPARAEPASLTALSRYINGIDSAVAPFTQINGDGSRSTGTLYIRRPGRARFEYDPPDDAALVVAGGGQVAIFDGRASGRPQQFPLSQTPLNLILARRVDLNRARLVTGIGEQGGRTVVEARDPDNPEQGTIRLYFETSPIRLAEWLITAQTGERTRVVLGPFQRDVSLSNFLFNIDYVKRQRE